MTKEEIIKHIAAVVNATEMQNCNASKQVLQTIAGCIQEYLTEKSREE